MPYTFDAHTFDAHAFDVAAFTNPADGGGGGGSPGPGLVDDDMASSVRPGFSGQAMVPQGTLA